MYRKGALYAPPCFGICRLLKNSKGNPELKILDFSHLLGADGPIENQQISFTSQSTFVLDL